MSIHQGGQSWTFPPPVIVQGTCTHSIETHLDFATHLYMVSKHCTLCTVHALVYKPILSCCKFSLWEAWICSEFLLSFMAHFFLFVWSASTADQMAQAILHVQMEQSVHAYTTQQTHAVNPRLLK